MPNIAAIINGHNERVLQSEEQEHHTNILKPFNCKMKKLPTGWPVLYRGCCLPGNSHQQQQHSSRDICETNSETVQIPLQ